MDYEGKGRVAPKPITVTLSVGEKVCIYRDAKRIASKRGEWRGSGWKGGLAGSLVVPGVGSLTQQERPIYLGLGGEYALAQTVNRRMAAAVFVYDSVEYDNGDGGVDFVAFGLTTQVKTRGRDFDSLIRRITPRKQLVPVVCDIAAFCEWNGIDSVKVLGWHFMDRIRELCPLHKSPVAEHWNLCVNDRELKPIGDMISEFQGRQYA